MDKIKISLIGTGHAGRVFHLPGLSKFEDIDISICDVNEDNLKAAAAEFGIPPAKCYSSWREMLDREKSNAVYLLLPQYHLAHKKNSLNVSKIYMEIAEEVLERRKALLVEKPLAMTLKDAERLVRAAEKAAVVTMVSVNRRFNPLVQYCKNEIEKKGSILNVNCNFYKSFLPEKNIPGVYLERLTSDMIHALDLMLYLMGGNVTKFYPKLQKTADDEVPTAFFAMADFVNGGTGIFSSNTRVGGRVQEWMLHGDGISCYIRDCFDPYDPKQKTGLHMEARILRFGGNTVERVTDTQLCGSENFAEYCGFTAADRYFIDCVRSGTQPHCNFANACKTVYYCNEIINSELKTVLR